MTRQLFLGIVLVLAGASCYGVLSTFVKMAYSRGYAPAEVLTAQFATGTIALAAIYMVSLRRAHARPSPRASFQLMAGGAAIGLTGTFYYLCVAYTSVSVAIVLLMQSVWMGVVVEAVRARAAPSQNKVAAVAMVLVGTALATDAIGHAAHLTPLGVAFGLAAAASYTLVMWVSGRVGLDQHPAARSFLMIAGGAVTAFAIAAPQLRQGFDPGVFWPWGVLTAMLGTVLPPFLFNRGVPLTGVGLAAILSAVELPVAILMASTVLGEPFSPVQWAGAGLIVAAIALSQADRRIFARKPLPGRTSVAG